LDSIDLPKTLRIVNNTELSTFTKFHGDRLIAAIKLMGSIAFDIDVIVRLSKDSDSLFGVSFHLIISKQSIDSRV